MASMHLISSTAPGQQANLNYRALAILYAQFWLGMVSWQLLLVVKSF